MKFSQNPISGVVECYTDDGVYIGRVLTMGDDLNAVKKESQPTEKRKIQTEK